MKESEDLSEEAIKANWAFLVLSVSGRQSITHDGTVTSIVDLHATLQNAMLMHANLSSSNSTL